MSLPPIPAAAEPGAPGALAGLKVLDMSRVLAGPLSGQILGDLGADVVKVEHPARGDDTRAWGPPYMPGADGLPSSEAAYFMSANRNKRSVALDIATAEGQATLRALAQQADVLIENFKLGDLARYGLDYTSLSALNPRLIYCSITGFGQTGPYAARAGYDFLVQGLGGLMSLTGDASGPMKAGVALVDVMTGLYADIGILAALAHRQRTGQGQQVDLSLLDVQIAGLVNQAMNYLATGRSPGRLGNAHPSIVPYQDFPTADGWMILAVGNDGQFARLALACEQPGWAEDPRFATNAQRVRHREALIALLSAATRQRSTADWIALLEDKAVPCGPINTLADVFADPHVRARGAVVTLPHAVAGTVPLVASPLRLSASPVSYRHAPPTLGQHTAQVLADWLGQLPTAANDPSCPEPTTP